MDEKLKSILKGEIQAVNVGLEIFADELESQGAKVIRVRFIRRPKLEKELKDILDILGS